MPVRYIHQLADWPHLSYRDDALLAPLAAVRQKQGHLLGRMAGVGFDIQAHANLQTVTQDVLTTSAIEGEILNPAEVRSSVARRLRLEVGGMIPARREVEGIVEVMLDATQNFRTPLTADRLFSWHGALFPTGRSGMHPITVGAWRPAGEPMQVVSVHRGRERVHYEAPDGERVPGEMGRFLDWFNAPLTIDPVLAAGMAHFWFITIHPFDDGNGRIARAVADMALARADGMPQRFYSMSAQIEAERSAYYLELELAQRGTTDITNWLLWFLGCFERAIDDARNALDGVLQRARTWDRLSERELNERQQRVLRRMLNDFQGFMTSSKYAAIAKCSPDTALRDIQLLVAQGVLLVNPGRGRSTSYRLAPLDG